MLYKPCLFELELKENRRFDLRLEENFLSVNWNILWRNYHLHGGTEGQITEVKVAWRKRTQLRDDLRTEDETGG